MSAYLTDTEVDIWYIKNNDGSTYIHEASGYTFMNNSCLGTIQAVGFSAKQ